MNIMGGGSRKILADFSKLSSKVPFVDPHPSKSLGKPTYQVWGGGGILKSC